MMFVRDSWNQESLSLWSIFAQPLQLASWPRPEQGMQKIQIEAVDAGSADESASILSGSV